MQDTFEVRNELEEKLLAEFKWVLERTCSGVGISINPDSPVGMDLEPGMIEQLNSTPAH